MAWFVINGVAQTDGRESGRLEGNCEFKKRRYRGLKSSVNSSRGSDQLKFLCCYQVRK
jgi:hypothetical protein